MKKMVYMLIFFLLLLPQKVVYGDDIKFLLTGESYIGNTISLNLEFNEIIEYQKFYGLTGILEYDASKLELMSIKGENKFNLTYNNKGNKIVLYNPNGIKDKNNIMYLSFKNINLNEGEETNIKITNVVASDGNKDIKISDINKLVTSSINIQDNDREINNYLSSIKINGKELKVDKDNLVYNVIVSYDTKKIIVDSSSDNGDAVIEGDGEYKLNVGTNEIEIKVKTENGDERDYIIDVTRESIDGNVDEEDLFIGKKRMYGYYVVAFLIVIFSVVMFNFYNKKKKI